MKQDELKQRVAELEAAMEVISGSLHEIRDRAQRASSQAEASSMVMVHMKSLLGSLHKAESALDGVYVAPSQETER